MPNKDHDENISASQAPNTPTYNAPNKDHSESAFMRPDAKYPNPTPARGRDWSATLPNQYKGDTVTVQRDAAKSDAGFVEGTDQVLIVFEDGSNRIVKRSEVS